VKPAVTEVAAVTEVEQVPVPLQAPPHPENVKPVPGISVRTTWVLAAKLALQVVGQLIPEGVLVTVPVPETDTARVYVEAFVELKVALTEVAAVTVTLQLAAVPQPPPVQLVKV
jgi:hypothetical protein